MYVTLEEAKGTCYHRDSNDRPLNEEATLLPRLLLGYHQSQSHKDVKFTFDTKASYKIFNNRHFIQ